MGADRLPARHPVNAVTTLGGRPQLTEGVHTVVTSDEIMAEVEGRTICTNFLDTVAQAMNQ